MITVNFTALLTSWTTVLAGILQLCNTRFNHHGRQLRSYSGITRTLFVRRISESPSVHYSLNFLSTCRPARSGSIHTSIFQIWHGVVRMPESLWHANNTHARWAWAWHRTGCPLRRICRQIVSTRFFEGSRAILGFNRQLSRTRHTVLTDYRECVTKPPSVTRKLQNKYLEYK